MPQTKCKYNFQETRISVAQAPPHSSGIQAAARHCFITCQRNQSPFTFTHRDNFAVYLMDRIIIMLVILVLYLLSEIIVSLNILNI